MTPPASTEVEIKLADLPQFTALAEFARDIETIAVERNDGELLTRVRRLQEELTAEDGQPEGKQ